MRKLTSVLAFILMATMLLGACTSAEPEVTPVVVTRIIEVTPTPETVVEEPFRIAVVMPCGTTDLGWCQALAEALFTLQEEAGGEEALEVVFSEYMWNPVDAAVAMRDYAAEGYDLIVGHSTTLSGAIEEAAREYPDTSFAWGTGEDPFQRKGINNVFTYNASGADPGYVLGVIAGMMTETGTLGIVGAVEGGEALEQHASFELGALSVDPEIEVLRTYTGSYGDVSLSTAAAEALIAAGADIMMGEGAQTGPVSAADAAGVFYFATAWDHRPLAPRAVAVCQLYRWENTFRDIIESIKLGVSGGKAYDLSFANGGYEIVFSSEVEIPAEVVEAYEATLAGILDGSINTHADE